MKTNHHEGREEHEEKGEKVVPDNLCRMSQLDQSSLSDEGLVWSAEELFLKLDRREAENEQGRSRGSGV